MASRFTSYRKKAPIILSFYLRRAVARIVRGAWVLGAGLLTHPAAVSAIRRGLTSNGAIWWRVGS